MFVVVYFFYYIYFVYLSRKWFVTSVLISEHLIFLKLVFKACWSRFQSDKHLLNMARKEAIFFCFKISFFQLVCIKGSCIVKLISLLHLFKSFVKAFHFFFFKAVIYKKYVLKCDKIF